MSERVALLLESPEGNTYAIICNSREAADKIREFARDECVGLAPIRSRVEAILGVSKPTDSEKSPE